MKRFKLFLLLIAFSAQPATWANTNFSQEPTEEVSEEEVIENEVKEFMVSEEEYSALLDRVAQLEEVLLGAVEALNSSNKTLTETVEKLSAQPAAEPIKRKIPVKENNALAGLKLGKK